jgi:hypothetical protein
MSRTQLNNIVLSIGVPGNTDIEIGQVVNIHIPQILVSKNIKENINLLYG